jgi:hypothetical protein
MVHSTILVQLRDPNSKLLAYDPPPPGYTGPIDDIIVFAHCVKHHGLTMFIDNRNFYGFTLVPLEASNSLAEERDQFLHVKLENIGKCKFFNGFNLMNSMLDCSKCNTCCLESDLK